MYKNVPGVSDKKQFTKMNRFKNFRKVTDPM